MKTSSLLLAAALSTVGLAWAESSYDTGYHDGIAGPKAQQNLSRKPYAAPVAKSESFEGAVVEETDSLAEKNYKTLQLHMLGKRPYAEKSTN